MRFLLCLLLFAVSCGIGGLWGSTASIPAFDAPNSPRTTTQFEWPDPKFKPREVVRLQLEGLRKFSANPDALRQCFVLASPANRAVTGPLDRFADMVQGPAYRALVSGAQALVGQTVTHGNRATVLVTLMGKNDQPAVFRFFLSRQTDAPFEHCWMTDAVMPPLNTQHLVVPPSPLPSA